MKKIQFVLPGVSRVPIGGFKVVYEYANRLQAAGYDCTILFMCGKTLERFHLPVMIRKLCVDALVWYFPKWFHLDKHVKKKAIFKWTDEEVPDGDFIVATSNSSAPLVNGLSAEKGEKIYLIQGFENWGETTIDFLYETYRMKMKKIVVSKWLKKKVDAHTEDESVYIPNGLDFSVFYIETLPKYRDPLSISMLYSPNPVKGSSYGIETLKCLKRKYPYLKAHLFGTSKRPKDLPNWIEYTKNASQDEVRKIYNESSIFLNPTVEEGFGLCGAESMACGCALVSSRYEGVLEYATDQNAVLCNIKSADELIRAVEELFADNVFRISIAMRGSLEIQALSWENSVNRLIALIESTT